MFDSKPEATPHRLFARKGEAIPTGAIEQRVVGNLMTETLVTGLEVAPNTEITRLNLSSLIRRRDVAGRVARAKPVDPSKADRQAVRKLKEIDGRLLPLDPEKSPADKATPEIFPSERPTRVAAIPENSPQLPAQRPKRHQFTVRLNHHDYHRFSDMAAQTGRTYQDIIEKAIRAYVSKMSSFPEGQSGSAPVNGSGKRAFGVTFRK